MPINIVNRIVFVNFQSVIQCLLTRYQNDLDNVPPNRIALGWLLLALLVKTKPIKPLLGQSNLVRLSL